LPQLGHLLHTATHHIRRWGSVLGPVRALGHRSVRFGWALLSGLDQFGELSAMRSDSPPLMMNTLLKESPTNKNLGWEITLIQDFSIGQRFSEHGGLEVQVGLPR
jgi:hypothetical protein